MRLILTNEAEPSIPGELLCGDLENFGFQVVYHQYMTPQPVEFPTSPTQATLEFCINVEGVTLLHGGSHSKIISPEKTFLHSTFKSNGLKLRRLPGNHEYITIVYSQAWIEMLLGSAVELDTSLFSEPQEYPWSPEIRDIVDISQSSNSSTSITQLPALTHRILAQILEGNKNSTLTDTVDARPHRRQRVIWMKQYLRQHLAKPLSLEDLSQKTGCTPSHLSRTFSESEGISLSQYLRNLRLDAARRHLAEDQLSITEIALETGYQSISHFSHIFHQHIGCTPQAYRQRFL
ncbi:MAG: AraC family transcriptional regulator [Verrucomicrobiota bacterium]